MSPIVELHGISKIYGGGHHEVRALQSVDLTVEPGALIAVHGRSGSGKTSLLNVIGGLDRANEGTAVVCGLDMMTADVAALAELRRTHVSFIFQAFGLLSVLSASEN